MMTILLNGHTQTLPTALTLAQLFDHLKLDSKAMAVAINQEIIPRSQFETQMVHENDRIEMIRATGGG